MHRLTRTVLAFLLAIALAAVLTGCGDQTADANAAIDASNAAVDKANEFDAAAVKLFDEIGALEPSEKSTDAALKLIAEADKAIEDKNAEVQKAIDELSKIESMDVSDEFKTYAKQQIEIAELQKETNALLLNATAEFKSVFENAGGSKPDMKALEASFTKIEEIFAQADQISTSIDEKIGTSDAYFEEQGLGE